MKCPHCDTGLSTKSFLRQWAFRDPERAHIVCQLVVDYCPVCKKAIVLLRKGRGKHSGSYCDRPSFELISSEQEELLFPRYLPTTVEPEVPEHYGKELVQAAAILSLSPKASAAMSRRLLQALLREEFGIKRSNLVQEIDVFLQRKDVPSSLADQVDAIRIVGNFAAHPIKNANTGEIVEIEPGEAEWLLDVLKELFDHIFVKPKRLAERKKKLNEKQKAARKPPRNRLKRGLEWCLDLHFVGPW